MQTYAKLSLSLARKRDMYVVLDADALWLVQKEPSIINGYAKAVLTPNLVEFKRLADALVGDLFRSDQALSNFASDRTSIPTQSPSSLLLSFH